MSVDIEFLGAARQVTGSRYVIHAGGVRLMIDCGLFQERAYVERNWACCPVPAGGLDAVLLTHAHLDHTGLLPRLMQEGFAGPIHATPPSIDLTRIILEDAAEIQEEDAAYKRKRHEREGRSGRFPETPLYTRADARAVLPLLKPVGYGQRLALGDAVTATWHDAGHILGSAMIEVTVREGERERVIVFSGDLGQPDRVLLKDPTFLRRADALVMESTYGDRDHRNGGDVRARLAELIRETTSGGGNLLIPTFAVERAQELAYHLARLARERAIPDVPVYLDSPMAAEVLEVFRRHRAFLDAEALRLLHEGEPLFDFPGFRIVTTQKDSKEINRVRGCVILAGSGMCTAGRIKHHLARNIGDPLCTICFTGYQAEGTLGREILDGNSPVRIHGERFEVRARVTQVSGLSAHADRRGLLAWFGKYAPPPRKVFLTHGEFSAARSLAEELRRAGAGQIVMPEYGSRHAAY
ncbi:MAG: Ribonuclease [Phycisphaerae bacterium]|nr:Ribonuclease [Phycisphaerae bacterium]